MDVGITEAYKISFFPLDYKLLNASIINVFFYCSIPYVSRSVQNSKQIQ